MYSSVVLKMILVFSFVLSDDFHNIINILLAAQEDWTPLMKLLRNQIKYWHPINNSLKNVLPVLYYFARDIFSNIQLPLSVEVKVLVLQIELKFLYLNFKEDYVNVNILTFRW